MARAPLGREGPGLGVEGEEGSDWVTCVSMRGGPSSRSFHSFERRHQRATGKRRGEKSAPAEAEWLLTAEGETRRETFHPALQLQHLLALGEMEDIGSNYEAILISPRWPVANRHPQSPLCVLASHAD